MITFAFFDIAWRQDPFMKDKNFRYFTMPPEARRHGHVKLGGICIRKLIHTECGFVGINPLGLPVPVAGPERPKDIIGINGMGIFYKPVYTAFNAGPAALPDMIGMN
jgi:hypothetical protein